LKSVFKDSGYYISRRIESSCLKLKALEESVFWAPEKVVSLIEVVMKMDHDKMAMMDKRMYTNKIERSGN
jgi:hypothetical protein